MPAATQWDHEVDVLCIGAEGSVLAAGVVAASAGFDVYLGISDPTAGGGDLVASLSCRGADKQTTEHISGFDYAFDSVRRGQALWPVRAVDDIAPPPPPRHRETLEPFLGASLEKWARRCAAAPNGVLYDRVGKRQMTEMRTSTRGEKVEAAVVGSVRLSPDLPALSLIDWLNEQATEAGLQRRTGVRLVKVIFEDNRLTGAVIDTPDGVQAVRARENFIIGVGDPMTECMPLLVSASEPVTVHVCLVSKAASRFGELEIVTPAGADDSLLFVPAPKTELAQGPDHQFPSWHCAV